MKARLKATVYQYVNARNARVIYIVLAMVALVLGAGAPDDYGLGGGGGGG